MFLSMQSLNGDSYQGAQVGANVQSQVGPPTRDGSWQGSAELSVSCLLDWAIHSAVSSTTKSTQSDLQLNVVIPPHCFQERLLAQIPNISTYVNAFGFDLNSWVGIGFLGMSFSPFSCVLILLSHFVIVCCCCLPFYFKLCKVVTEHTHLVCTRKHQKEKLMHSSHTIITTLSSSVGNAHQSASVASLSMFAVSVIPLSGTLLTNLSTLSVPSGGYHAPCYQSDGRIQWCSRGEHHVQSTQLECK